MTLRRIVEYIRSHEKELSLFNVTRDDPIADELATYFATQNVQVRTERTASGTPEVAVLSTDETVLTTVPVSSLRALADAGPTGSDRPSDPHSVAVLTHLKETTFTSYDTEQLLYASREIEDRARRVGDGTIHAGFQRVSLMADQQPVYADLARRGVEVHAYGVPDAPPPEFGSGQIHAVETDEIAASWFVVFDGAGKDIQKSALLAVETDPDTFYGAWTYDAAIVDRTFAYLHDTYL